MRIPFALPILSLVVVSGSLASGPGSPPLLPAERSVWKGEVTVDKVVVVNTGQELTIEPGSHLTFREGGRLSVHGRLTIAGTTQAPVRISQTGPPAGAQVELIGASALAEVGHAYIAGADQAFSVQGGALVLQDSRLESNGLAVRLGVKALARIEGSRFSGNRVALSVESGGRADVLKTEFLENQGAMAVTNGSSAYLDDVLFEKNAAGLAVMHTGDVLVRESRFIGNGTAVRSEQSGKGPHISKSSFRNNRIAIESTLHSHPLVEGSNITDNETGASFDQFCGPFIRYNDFSNNNTAVKFDKKSNGRVSRNLFSKNQIAVFADFSSYPEILENLFEENSWHVRLGPQESADFERRRGSAGLTHDGAQRRGPGRAGRVPAPMRRDAPDLREQTFSVARNAWDRDTRREMEAGQGANVKGFWDGKDQGEVRYEGFGDDLYAVDSVVFLPTADLDRHTVGSRAWTPYRPEASAAEPRPQSPPPSSPDNPSAPDR